MTTSPAPSRVTNAPAVGAEAAPTLAVLRQLFDRLHDAGIRYCHWKSNEHVGATMAGATDVDVLVDRAAIVPLARILGECNFKRFVVKAGRGYPGIEDYVGFDEATGALTHFHVHYQLTLGEKFLKGHRLPWEELYLTTRVFDEHHGLYVADPHLELIVLVVRQSMKLRLRDLPKAAAGKSFFRGGMLREFRWLAERVEPERVVALATRLLGERAARLFPAVLAAGRPSTLQLRALRRHAHPRFREYRLYTALGAISRGWRRELSIVWWKLSNWYRRAPTKSTRTLPQGGITIAVLGADGAGKSTIVGELAEWLSHDVAVTRTYGGSGTGSATLPRQLIQSVARWRRRLLRGAPAPPGSSAPPSARAPTAARAVWVLALARERVRRALETRRARGQGMVVLADRLAQSQFPGMNDGPRLAAWLDSPSAWRRRAAQRERAAFRLSELVPPDLVIKLHVPPEVALTRKPETPREQVLRGTRLVRDLTWPATTRVVDLDATQPLDQVILRAKRAVWEAI
jgi:thymidylate kinase